jgi:hypothetical protein
MDEFQSPTRDTFLGVRSRYTSTYRLFFLCFFFVWGVWIRFVGLRGDVRWILVFKRWGKHSHSFIFICLDHVTPSAVEARNKSVIQGSSWGAPFHVRHFRRRLQRESSIFRIVMSFTYLYTLTDGRIRSNSRWSTGLLHIRGLVRGLFRFMTCRSRGR